jgi:hypothetical protein
MGLWNDIRFGARSLRKAPGFTATAILTLALGIGATTAIFSVADAMLWKPVPLPHLESLMLVLQRVPGDPNDWNSVPPADVEDIRQASTSFDSFASWDDGVANIVGPGGEPERVYQILATADFFHVMGVQPAIGRGFQAGEDQPGREREVVLSDKIWRRRFGADPGIVGQNIRLDDQDYQVTGVMPPKFDFPLAADIWTPLALKPEDRASRRFTMLQSIVRLKPGRGVEQAQAELDAMGARLGKTLPGHQQRPALYGGYGAPLPGGRLQPPIRADALWGRRVRAADRLRECGQPAIRPRPGAGARGGAADGAGSRALAPRLAACGRKRDAGAGRRNAWPVVGQLGHQYDPHGDARGSRKVYPGLERHPARRPHTDLHDGGGRADRNPRRVGARLAAFAAGPERSAEGRGPRLVERARAAASPDRAGGRGNRTGGGAAGGRGPDGARLPRHGGRRRRPGTFHAADPAARNHERQVQGNTPGGGVLP